MEQYRLTAPQRLDATVELPASKSISNRALIIYALSGGTHLPENLSDCDDTNVIIKALQEMPEEIDIMAAGTAMRFMTAYLSVVPNGTHVLTGTERMKHRNGAHEAPSDRHPRGCPAPAWCRHLVCGRGGLSPTPYQRQAHGRRPAGDTWQRELAVYLCPADDRTHAEEGAHPETHGPHHLKTLHRPDTVDDAGVWR